jgi:hypothetical protein
MIANLHHSCHNNQDSTETCCEEGDGVVRANRDALIGAECGGVVRANRDAMMGAECGGVVRANGVVRTNRDAMMGAEQRVAAWCVPTEML